MYCVDAQTLECKTINSCRLLEKKLLSTVCIHLKSGGPLSEGKCVCRSLLGVVVHPLQQQQHLQVHRLREQIHGHRSHRAESSAVNSLRRSSAQTETERDDTF